MEATEKPSALLHKIGIGRGLQFQKPRTPSTVFVTLDPASFETNNNKLSSNNRKRKAFEDGSVQKDECEHHHSVIKNLRIEFVDESGELQSLSSGSGSFVKTKENEVSSKQERTSGVWNADTHLYLWNRARHCINIFAESSLTQVNSAITDDLNLHHFLGREVFEPTPLDFSLTVAICVGAAAVGERAMEHEYWMRARHQAGSLFDLTDFNVAAALQHLSEYAIHSGRHAEGIYYATSGVSICERLGKQHTGVYLWLLISSLLGAEPGTFWSKLPAVRHLPVFEDDDDDEEEENEQEGRRRTRKGKEKIKEIGREETESEDEDSYDAIARRATKRKKRNNRNVDDYDEGSAALDALCTELVMHVSGSYAQAMTNLDNPTLLKALDGVLGSLQRQWELVRHVFTRGQRLGMDIGLSAVVTAVKQARGRTHEALASALVFTDHAQDPLFPYMLVLKEGTYHPLKVLLDTGNYFILHSLVNILQHKNGGTFLDGVLEDFKPFLKTPNT